MSGSCPVVRIKSTHPASQGDFVEIDASAFDPKVHERYDEPAAAPAPPPAPPPPPADIDPLAGLAADWRTEAGAMDLRKIANALTGRTVANRQEAVEVIDAEIEKRKAGSVPPPPPPV